MHRRFAVLVFAVLFVATSALAAEIGPRALRGRTTVVRNNLARMHDGIAREARDYVRANTVRMRRDLTFQELVGRWVPGAGDLAGGGRVSIDRTKLSPQEARMLTGYARQMSDAAHLLVNGGLGGEGIATALRANALDPRNAKAGQLLGYQLSGGAWMHPAAATYRRQRLAPSRFGWLPEQLAGEEKSGYAPDLGRWQRIRDVDARHTTWTQRHVLTFTHIQVQTTLGLAEIIPWARDVDAMVGWMRARFLRIPGYREPAWPLVLKVYRNTGEIRTAGEQPPSQPAVWTGEGIVEWSGASRAGWKLPNIAQMLFAQGFLSTAFPRERRGTTYSGWMEGAWSEWCYFAEAAWPEKAESYREGVKSTLGAVAIELRLGRDVFGRLRPLSYAQGRASDLRRAAGLLVDMGRSDALAWEGVGRFIANVEGRREARGDFEELLGATAIVSAATAEWVRTAPGSGGHPGTGGGTGPGASTLTVGAPFLKGLGVDVEALAGSVGDIKAREIAVNVLSAYFASVTAAGRPGAGVRVTLRDVPGRYEWAVDLRGRPHRVKAFVDAVLWRAGVRPPPEAPSVDPGGETPPPPDTYVPPGPGPGTPPAGQPGSRLFDVATANYAKSLLRSSREVTPEVMRKIARGDRAAVEILLGLMRSAEANTRSSAALILGRVGPVHPGVLPALGLTMKDADVNVRLNTLQAFRNIGAGAKQSVPDIAAVMVSDREWNVRQRAALALQPMPSEDLKGVLPTLLTGMRDREPKVRAEVVKILEKVAEAHPETRTQIRIAILTSGGGSDLLDELLKRLGD